MNGLDIDIIEEIKDSFDSTREKVIVRFRREDGTYFCGTLDWCVECNTTIRGI